MSSAANTLLPSPTRSNLIILDIIGYYSSTREAGYSSSSCSYSYCTRHSSTREEGDGRFARRV
jgi:hypothetical protein